MSESGTDQPAPASASYEGAAEANSPESSAEIPGWDKLGLAPELLRLIQNAGYKAPTIVQAQSIPVVLEGGDLLASAPTGTGKTAAFVLPLVQKLKGREGTYGLILAPTREIANQTKAVLDVFGGPLGIRAAVLIGGIDMKLDTIALNTYPQIIVATPGRLCDHLDRGNIWLDYLEHVVLDEADRMLDMGFSDQLNRILDDTPNSRQTLLFSATFPPIVEKLAGKILHDPKRISIGRSMKPTDTVEQSFIFTEEADKLREVTRILRNETGSVFVFARSKERTTNLWRSLRAKGILDAAHLHSDLRQRDREQALADFKEGKYRILVATDVMGRGIDVAGVAHVINFDLPRDPSDYIHRIGRTGRAEATGKATSLITRGDRETVGKLEKLLGKSIRPETREQGPRSHQARGQAQGISRAPSPVQASGSVPRPHGQAPQAVSVNPGARPSSEAPKPQKSRGGRGRRGNGGSGTSGSGGRGGAAFPAD
jgi:ATP-dependent RNA helicase RhlE